MTNNKYENDWGQFVNIENNIMHMNVNVNKKTKHIVYSDLSIISIIAGLLSFVGYDIE